MSSMGSDGLPIHERHRIRRILQGLAVLVLVVAGSAVSSPASAMAVVTPGAVDVTPASAATVRPTLRLGARGPHVVQLQQRLAALHYDVGGVDGVFGDSTLHGVIAFQKVQRIGVDGTVGPITWNRLDRPVVPAARYRRSAAALEVNLALRVVYVTQGGVVTRILDASPGKPATPTVTGTFSITRRIDGWHRSPLGMLWRPNYFYRGYALHGYTSVPTYAASHGCVRVTIPAMNRLWSQLFLGERVYVYR